MAEDQYKLSQADVEHFLEHGWIKLSNCFTRDQSAELQATMWTRLGMDPDDMSTWHSERINMPWFKAFSVEEFAPKAWGGICSLLGGSSRVDPIASTWKDGFIVNLGTPAGLNKHTRPQDLTNWHVDGDFFVHYLDSPEQALLVIPMWSDVVPGGGGTFICPRAIDTVAKHLHEHPEGVSPRMTLREENPEFKQEQGLRWTIDLAKSMPDEAFVEVTGVVGDVYLLHPLMLHSASHNPLRKVRVITNPPVSVKEPFQFYREDGDYSVVERKTLRALGKEGTGLPGWKITHERQRLVPERVRIQEEMKKKEAERLRALKGTSEGPEGVKQVETIA